MNVKYAKNIRGAIKDGDYVKAGHLFFKAFCFMDDGIERKKVSAIWNGLTRKQKQACEQI